VTFGRHQIDLVGANAKATDGGNTIYGIQHLFGNLSFGTYPHRTVLRQKLDQLLFPRSVG